MSVDKNTTAAKNFYRLVRTFAERNKPWQPAIYYDVKPDEAWDCSLVSQRVYGNRNEFLAIMAAAGLDRFDMPLQQKRLTLPTFSQLTEFKRQAGFESNPDLRLV